MQLPREHRIEFNLSRTRSKLIAKLWLVIAIVFQKICMLVLDKLYQIGELSKACLSSGAVHSFGDEKGQAPLVESCVDDLLALKCCIENNRWAEFIDWRACPPRCRPTKNRTHSTE